MTDGQGGHDQHRVPHDGGVQARLALVQAVQAGVVLAELEIPFARPVQRGRPD